MKGRCFAGALPLMFAAAFLLRPSPTPQPAAQYRQAVSLLREFNFTSAAAKAHRIWQSNVPSEWKWRFRLVEAEALIEGGKTAEGLALLKTGSAATTPEFEIRRRVLTAGKSKFEPAKLLLAEARELAERNSRLDLEPLIDIQLARQLMGQKDATPAEPVWENARRSAEAAGDTYLQALAINGLGALRMRRSRCAEAIPLYEKARQLWLGIGATQWPGGAAANIATCYSRLGDFDRELTYAEEALRLLRPSRLLANAYGEVGLAHYLQQEPAQAIPYLRKATDMARAYGARREAAQWAGNLTMALIDINDWDGAELALQDAFSFDPEANSLAHLNLDRAEIARGRNRLAEARAIYEQEIASNPDDPSVKWPAYASIAKSWAAEGNTEMASRNYEAAIRVIEESQSDLSGQQNKITFLSRLMHFYQEYVAMLMAGNQTVKALAVADGSRARVLSQRFDYRMPATTPLREAEFQSIARQSGSIWLSYWLAPNQSFLWVTTPHEICFFTLKAPAAEIATLVEEYRGAVEAMRDPLRAESEAGRRLYEILIAPAAGMIPAGSHVIVVPDGPLHQLSFETLPVYSGPSPHYWIEDAAVSIAPSFGVFRGDRQSPVAGWKSLLIGDALSPGAGFTRLEFAAGEIAAVEKHLKPGATKVTGADARPDIWKQRAPGNFDLIHFAAHAEANRRSPLDSAVILSPGLSPSPGFRLYARDIIDVKLHANLVTLSACRSSGARTYAGEGLVGLTWAFLQAGSRNVVAGLWNVADESTSLLMDRFYAGIAQGTEPAEALRGAQLSLLRGDYAKPYYWGAFQCYRL